METTLILLDITMILHHTIMATIYLSNCSDYAQQQINSCAYMLMKLDALQETVGIFEKSTMSNIFRKSRDEFLDICDAYNLYNGCVGDNSVKEQCYSQEPFHSRYASIDESLSYACGEGYPSLFMSWYCVQEVASGVIYMKCLTTLRTGHYDRQKLIITVCKHTFIASEHPLKIVVDDMHTSRVLMTIRHSGETLFPYCTLAAMCDMRDLSSGNGCFIEEPCCQVDVSERIRHEEPGAADYCCAGYHVLEMKSSIASINGTDYVCRDFMDITEVIKPLMDVAFNAFTKNWSLNCLRWRTNAFNENVTLERMLVVKCGREKINVFLGSAESISDLIIEEDTAEGMRSDKWVRKFCRKFTDNLNMRSVIASLVLSILLLNFDAFCNSNGQLSQRESAPPRPFFPPNSKKYLIDYYTGDNAKPENLLHNSEIVIVMYYAPWSRRCTRTRVVDIAFAESYSSAHNSIRYKSFLDEFDDAIIAFFHAEIAFAISYEFQQYIKAALIVYQYHDLLDKVGFAVVINSSLATSLNSSRKTWIQLRSWNRTFSYDGSNMTAYKIFEWVKNTALKSNGLQWIYPEMNGVAKSEELLSVLQHGATVLVFIDRQVLYPHNWAVSVVEQTIMEYYACNADLISQMKSRSNKLDALINERSRIVAMSSHKCREINAHTMGAVDKELLCTVDIKNQHLDISQGTFEQCAKYRLARDLYHHISDSSQSICCPFDATSVTGLSCDKNNSLRFIGIDSRYGDYILKRLTRPYYGQTVALIVDSSTERTFLCKPNFPGVLSAIFTRISQRLIDAARNFPCLTEGIKNMTYNNFSILLSTNAKTFRTDVNSSEDTVVFFSGGNWHGPSVIDVSLNDLPWQFQMDALPAVLFFPAGRKSSSSRFPTLVPFTVPNLISFIVTRCRKELRWQLALSSCSLLCIKKNSLRLQKTLRTTPFHTETSEGIIDI
ncbi:Lipase maturation factor [Dirofilaria immitis]|nr:Lipase maturation factor [Dirofilaria immitis]